MSVNQCFSEKPVKNEIARYINIPKCETKPLYTIIYYEKPQKKKQVKVFPFIILYGEV